MTGWLESAVGPDYAIALMWTIVALIVLLVLLIVIRIARSFNVGTFIAGGRNRKARLAVIDATAVDSHRRLVLVRRDDVEHLILIGGPSDVVVEQNIRLIPPARRHADEETSRPRMPAPETASEPPRSQPQTPPRPPAAMPRHAPAAAAMAPVATPSLAAPPVAPRSAPPIRPESRAPQAAPVVVQPPAPIIATPAPVAPVVAATTVDVPPTRLAGMPAHAAAPAHAVVAAPRKSEIDEALLHELEASFDSKPASSHAAAASGELDATLDEEMSRLLNDLAGKR